MRISTKIIEIDINVHRAIEARRMTFDQSPNDILRTVFGVSEAAPSPSGAMPPAPSMTRRTGRFPYTLLKEENEGKSYKEVYIGCLRKLAERDPQFLERLSAEGTRRRRIVARTQRDLYISTPGLSEKNYCTRLTDEWWVDTNLSQAGYKRRLEIACDVAGIRFGEDLVLDFAN